MQRRDFLKGLGASLLFFQLTPIFTKRKMFLTKRKEPLQPPTRLQIMAVGSRWADIGCDQLSMAIVNYQVSIDEGPWIDLDDLISPVTVSGLTPDTTYNSFRLRSVDGAGNVSEPSEAVGPVTTDAAATPINYRYNIGVATPFSPFLADPGPSSGSSSTAAEGAADLTGLTDPAPASVYLSKRYANPGDSFTYSFAVNAGQDYKIRIHQNLNDALSDPMKVTINGVAQALYSPYADNGSVAHKGSIKEYTVTQGGGTTMTVKFEGNGSTYAQVWGIEVLEIVPMTISTAALPEATKDSVYSTTLTTSDEVGAVTWALSSGTLPTGLSFNTSTGAITGTPTALASVSLMFEATDSTAQVAHKIFTLVVDQPPSTYLLDVIADTPLLAYSTRKLAAAYAGDCLRVRRLSDNTEQDIGFNANGNLDRAAMLAFGTQLEIVKWYDQMGNEDLIEAATAKTGVPAYTHFISKRDGISYGSTEVADKSMTTAGTIAVTAPKVFMAVNAFKTDKGWKSTDAFYLFDFHGNQFLAQMLHGSLNLYNGVAADCGRFDGGKHQLTVWFQTGTADKVRIDGVDHVASDLGPSSSNAGDTARTERFTLGNYGLGGVNHLQGVVGECLVFDGTVGSYSDIEDSQSAYFLDATPVAPTLAYTKQVILEGDSRTDGFNAINNKDTQSWAVRLDALLDSTWRIRKVAYSGERLIDEYTPEAAFEVNPYYNASLTKNIVVVWGVINDFHLSPGTYTGANLYAAMQTLVASYQAAGFKVIVCTDPDTDPSNLYISGVDYTEYNNYNTLLRANHAFADGFVDLNLVTELSDATNTTYFDDGTHLTLAGANKVAEAIYPVIIAL